MAKKKILIIDDEKDFTALIKTSLESTDKYTVKAENKAVNGLTACQQFRPDLILLDVMMPGMDGGDVASQIKEEKAFRDTPIIFMTAAITKDEVDAGTVVGKYPFIAKPVSVEEVIKIIGDNLR